MKHLTYLLLLCLSGPILRAQLSDTQTARIDSIFLDWNQANHPGGSIAVRQHGKTIYNQAFGLASLNYLVPNGTGTIYNIASVSKQFTSMGILLLEKQGKLSVKDDIRKHLPELPDFGQVITIEQMMQHTSGLRSLHAMLEMAGWRGDDSRDNDDLMRFMQRQQDLNFEPGSQALYCNTGYILMAVIIERISGESFRDWMRTNIFLPLDMPDTYVEDEYDRVVSGNATSYYGSQAGDFSRAVEYWGYVGSGNMHSTTADLLNWLCNYHDPQQGWEDLFAKIQTPTTLNDGTVIEYGYGVNTRETMGRPNVAHGGAIGGFRSFATSFPDDELDIVVLSNFSASGVSGRALQIAEVILAPVEAEEEDVTEAAAMETIELSAKELRRFEAWYWEDDYLLARRVYLEDDSLRFARPNGRVSVLVPRTANSFYLLGADNTIVSFEGKGKDQRMLIEEGSLTATYVNFAPPEITPDYLGQYTGKFYSEELDTYYTFSLQEGHLVGYHARHGEFGVTVLKDDVLQADNWVVRTIRSERDKNGKIISLRITNGRVRNAHFKKVE